MKFEVADSFHRDFKKLRPEHKAAFKKVIDTSFVTACDAWADATERHKTYVWPKALRVAELVASRGVMEMTWSFASPDGRATFRFERHDGQWYCFWRRIGDHGVFDDP